MKYLIDSANLDEIRALSEYLPIAGVTSNPSIVKKEGSVPFFAHMREIRSIIGNLRPLHIQVTATDYDGMMRDAEAVFRHVDEKVFIKVPVDFEGVKVIKALRRQGKRDGDGRLRDGSGIHGTGGGGGLHRPVL